MTDAELLGILVRLAGDLFGAEDSEADELHRTLIRALRRGQPPSELVAAASAARPWPRPETLIDDARLVRFRELIGEPDDSARATPLILRRTDPLAPPLAPGAWPDWARARQPARTLGPFREATTRRVWFDIWEDAARFTIYRAAAQGPGLEPLIVLTGKPVASGARFTLEQGDVWISATAFDSAAPANSWAGLAARSLAIDVDRAPLTTTEGTAVVSHNAQVRLVVTPRDAFATHPGSAVASTAKLTFAGDLTITLGPSGGSLAGNAALSLLGAGSELVPDSASAPRFDSQCACLLFAASIDADAIEIPERTSGVWGLAGRSAMQMAALALPVCRLAGQPTNRLGAVDGSPAAWLSLDTGITIDSEWLRNEAELRLPVALASIQLLARTGEFWMTGRLANFVSCAERLEPLWADGGGLVPARSGFAVAHGRLGAIEAWSDARGENDPSDGMIRRGAKFTGVLARPATVGRSSSRANAISPMLL